MVLGICDNASFIFVYEIFGVLVISAVNGISVCGDGWILSERSQKCFYVSNEKLNYWDAQTACENIRLESVAYEEDVQALQQGTKFPVIDYWIDMYKESHTPIENIDDRRASFRWGDGSANTEWMGSFWAGNEPGLDERYCRLADNMSSFKGIRDSGLNGYICQKLAPSSETTTFSSTIVETQTIPSGRAQQFTTTAVFEANTREVSSNRSTLEVINASGCGDGWIFSERSQKCFYVANEMVSYRGAQAACENISGQTLACVAYEEDVQALKQGTNLPLIEYWIGLYKEIHTVINDIDERRKQFSWRDGSPNRVWMGTFWAEQEPGISERYGRLGDNMSSFKGHSDDALNGYICQTSAPVTTSSSSTTVVTQTIHSGRAQQFTTIAVSIVNTQEVSSNESTLEVTNEIDSMVYIAAGVGGGVGLVLVIVTIVVVVIVIRKRKYGSETNKATQNTYENTIADPTSNQEATIRRESKNSEAGENQTEDQKYEILDTNDYERVDDLPQVHVPNGNIDTRNTHLYTGINVQDIVPQNNEYAQLETTYERVETDSITDHRVGSHDTNNDYELL